MILLIVFAYGTRASFSTITNSVRVGWEILEQVKHETTVVKIKILPQKYKDGNLTENICF